MAQRRDPMVITLPRTPLFLRAAQMAASTIAVQLDLTCDRVRDLRTAVGEACDHLAALSPRESGGTIHLSLLVDRSKLSVSVEQYGPRRMAADLRDGESALRLALLAELVDEIHIADDGLGGRSVLELICGLRRAVLSLPKQSADDLRIRRGLGGAEIEGPLMSKFGSRWRAAGT